MKKNKTTELKEIESELNNLFQRLPDTHEFKKNYRMNLWVTHGKMHVRYQSYWKDDSIGLDVAKLWLEFFRKEPQKHFAAQKIIEAENDRKAKEKIESSFTYYILENHTLINAKLITIGKKQIKLSKNDYFNSVVSYDKDLLNKRIFDSHEKAKEALKNDIQNEINRLQLQIHKLSGILENI